jgi:hypothetical protein
MGYNDFNELSLKDRSDLIWEWGNFISKETSMGMINVLFTLDGLFVRVTMESGSMELNSIRAIPASAAQSMDVVKMNNKNPFLRILMNRGYKYAS